MIIRIDTPSKFINEFHFYGCKDQFSYDALHRLFEYYEGLSEDWELDVIAICHEWQEYDNLKDMQEDYAIDSIKELEDETTVLYCKDYRGNICSYLVESL